ncbi:hypothetical protein V4B17_01780 [Bartonella sp. B23]
MNNTDYALLYIGVPGLLDDVKAMQSYRRSFAVEDHLGFDESTQKIHLECAAILAVEAEKSKQLSYALIEKVQRVL